MVVARKEDENELVSTRTEQPRAPRVVLGRFPPLVTMMKSTHSRQRDDFRRRGRPRRDGCFIRCVFVQSQVATVLVVVVDVGPHESDEMPLAEDHDVFEESLVPGLSAMASP